MNFQATFQATKAIATLATIFFLIGCEVPEDNNVGNSYVDIFSYDLSMREDTQIEFNIDGDDVCSSELKIVSYPYHGTIAIEDNTGVYTPEKDFFGNDSFMLSCGKVTSTDYKQLLYRVTVKDVPEENVPPVISGIPITNYTTNSNYYFKPIAYDENDDILTFYANNLPDWLSIDEETGEITGITPDYSIYITAVTLYVTDGLEVASLTFDINVSTGNHAPTISGVPSTEITEGQNYYFKPTAKDIDGDALTFSIANAPKWMDFNKYTGEMSGIAEETPDYFSGITISVTDGEYITKLTPFDLRVLPAEDEED